MLHLWQKKRAGGLRSTKASAIPRKFFTQIHKQVDTVAKLLLRIMLYNQTMNRNLSFAIFETYTHNTTFFQNEVEAHGKSDNLRSLQR